MIKVYDKELIEDILLPFDLKTEEKDKDFCGYKMESNAYYSFFFSLYKKEILIFSFRFNPKEKNIERIIVSYNNVDIIKLIINSILKGEFVDEKIYCKYVLDEDDFEKRKEEIENEEKMCHWKLSGLVIPDDPNGTDISNLNISLRLRNALYRYDIFTINQFLKIDTIYLYHMKYLGKKCFEEAINIKSILLGLKRSETSVFNELSNLNNEKVELNDNIFKVNEKNYLDNDVNVLEIRGYEKVGKIIVDKTKELITNSNKITDRSRNILLKYACFDNSKVKTLENIGNEYGLSRERIRQIINKSTTKVRKNNSDLIKTINNYIDENFYLYLIYGIIKQYNLNTLKVVLMCFLNKNNYNKIYEKINRCIILKSKNAKYNMIEIKTKPNNAGAPWSDLENMQLIDEFKTGKSIKEISNIHSRTCGAIRSRLKKFNLIDK